MATSARWHAELTRYHWFVLVVAALGWLFDTMDQQIFTMARVPALRELLATADGPPQREELNQYGGIATSIFLLGWATGGLTFGILGDRFGRAKTMLWTILIYSLCTGLSALSVGFWDFAFYRFITGLGVGGEFAVGVALVAEVMPSNARPFALGLLQALSAIGNISAALIAMGLGQLEGSELLHQISVTGNEPVRPWRLMFLVGILPALLAVFIRRRLKEPEQWQSMAASDQLSKQLGSYRAMFGVARWRRHALLGLMLAFAGVVGLWGIGFFSVDLLDSVLRKRYSSGELSPDAINREVTFWKGIALIVQNVGGFLGIYAFTLFTERWGRRPAFALFFTFALLSTAYVFLSLQEFSQIFWMLPTMGFFQFALFGGYAIYFPELFPTYLRSTGTSFCYNVGRFVAAIGPLSFGALAAKVFSNQAEPMRYAGAAMSAVFVVGLLALPFLPETKGKPLPE